MNNPYILRYAMPYTVSNTVEALEASYGYGIGKVAKIRQNKVPSQPDVWNGAMVRRVGHCVPSYIWVIHM